MPDSSRSQLLEGRAAEPSSADNKDVGGVQPLLGIVAEAGQDTLAGGAGAFGIAEH